MLPLLFFEGGGIRADSLHLGRARRSCGGASARGFVDAGAVSCIFSRLSAGSKNRKNEAKGVTKTVTPFALPSGFPRCGDDSRAATLFFKRTVRQPLPCAGWPTRGACSLPKIQAALLPDGRRPARRGSPKREFCSLALCFVARTAGSGLLRSPRQARRDAALCRKMRHRFGRPTRPARPCRARFPQKRALSCRSYPFSVPRHTNPPAHCDTGYSLLRSPRQARPRRCPLLKMWHRFGRPGAARSSLPGCSRSPCRSSHWRRSRGSPRQRCCPALLLPRAQPVIPKAAALPQREAADGRPACVVPSKGNPLLPLTSVLRSTAHSPLAAAPPGAVCSTRLARRGRDAAPFAEKTAPFVAPGAACPSLSSAAFPAASFPLAELAAARLNHKPRLPTLCGFPAFPLPAAAFSSAQKQRQLTCSVTPRAKSAAFV